MPEDSSQTPKRVGIFRNSYPSQHNPESNSAGFVGELRGFYPSDSAGAGTWLPTYSTFLGRLPKKGQTKRTHAGVDIYAPFAPTPLEVPVVAVRGGLLTRRSGTIEPESLGNRAKLEVKLDDGTTAFIQYGHLNRFKGRDPPPPKTVPTNPELDPRWVAEGTIIGYAGCSGNANDRNECTKVGDAHVNAGHVHLMRIAGGDEWNPARELGLELDAMVLDPVTYPKQKAEDWVTANGGAEKFPKRQEPEPNGTQSRMIVTQDPFWYEAPDGRRPLAAPFEAIEFADPELLATTQSFYDMCARRHAGQVKGGTTDLSAFCKHRREAARNELLDTEWLDRLSKLIEVKAAPGTATKTLKGFGPGADKRKFATYAMRHIARLTLMLWHLYGGAALDLLAANAKGETKELRNVKEKGLGNLASTALPECGAGIWGTAWLSACDDSANAVHDTSYHNIEWIGSVTFGAGSLRHATVGKHISEKLPADSPASAYCADLETATKAVTNVHNIVHRHSLSLSGEGDPELGDKARALFVAAILGPPPPPPAAPGSATMETRDENDKPSIGALPAIVTAANRLKSAERETIAAHFIKAAAEQNRDLFAALATEASTTKEGFILSPFLMMASAQAPAPAPPKPPEGDAGKSNG